VISRRSTRLIGQAYTTHFPTGVRLRDLLFNPTLYDFLYDREYEAWFLSIAKSWIDARIPIDNEIMRIHTGESIVSATQNLEWNKRRELGQTLLKRLATDILRIYENLKITATNPADPKTINTIVTVVKSMFPASEVVKILRKQLELDGYIFRDGNLYFNESSVIKEREEQSILKLLVDNLPIQNKPVILNHLKLSEEHYLNGKWGDSIANTRNFLEEILKQIALKMHDKKQLTTPFKNKPFEIRDFLEQEGFIEKTEKEAIAKVYGLISNTGSHPEKDLRHEPFALRIQFCPLL
jgi:hypothetical protein